MEEAAGEAWSVYPYTMATSPSPRYAPYRGRQALSTRRSLALPEGATTPSGQPIARPSFRTMHRPYRRTPSILVPERQWRMMVAAEEHAYNRDLAEGVFRAIDRDRAKQQVEGYGPYVYSVVMRFNGLLDPALVRAVQLDDGRWQVRENYIDSDRTDERTMDTRALLDRLAERMSEPTFYSMRAEAEDQKTGIDVLLLNGSTGWDNTYVPTEAMRLWRAFDPMVAREWFPHPSDCDFTLGAIIPFLKRHLRARLESSYLANPDWVEYLLEVVDNVEQLLVERCGNLEFYHAYRLPTETSRVLAIGNQ